MEQLPIYTIGHGSRSISDFIRLVKAFGITYIIDVRSQPYSKYNPQYNQNELNAALQRNGIRYVFMGDELGGRPVDPTCYDNEGKVDYEQLKTKAFFKQGIGRITSAYEKKLPIAIMCSESDPKECHRSKLIGRTLSSQHLQLKHIDEKGRLKTQADVINELNKGRSDVTLFPDEVSINTTSRKSYH